MEFGPRSLGARSIIGDPRDTSMQRTMNLKIKFRESFRPFAPAVLEEDMKAYFDVRQSSPYMLLVGPVREELRIERRSDHKPAEGLAAINEVRSTIPAVTHVDYSARVQTVSDDTHPAFASLLRAFKRKTGCPVLVNTSFNVRGEPIVCTPAQAYACFMRTGIDVLVLGHYILRREDQPPFHEEVDWREAIPLD
jgi:carbamoyltransferase